LLIGAVGHHRQDQHGECSGLFGFVAALAEGTVVLLLGEDVPGGGEEQCDRPLDDVQRDEYSDRATVGDLLGPGQAQSPDYRQVEDKVIYLVTMPGGGPPRAAPGIRSSCARCPGDGG